MSQPDPNNPYAKAPQGNDPYSAPPQGPAQGPPQGPPPSPYAYPQQAPGQPYGAYPGGVPGMPPQPAGTVKAARVLLFVLGGLGTLGGLLVTAGGAMLGNADVKKTIEDQGGLPDGVSAGLLVALGVFSLALSIASIVVGAKFASGASGVRVAAIVCGALNLIAGIFYLPLGSVWIVGGGLIAAFAAMKDGAAWFGRPRV